MPGNMPRTAALLAAAWLLPLFLPLHSAAAQPDRGPYLVYLSDLDIVAADFDNFMSAAKANAAASKSDPGCRAFSILIAQDDPHHVLFIEVYDDAAALTAHQATGHFKTYMAITNRMIASRRTRQFTTADIQIKER
jgi:(4S)-4-hydroxy-5-phosphonooxypentane-2,3-dione isomerase